MEDGSGFEEEGNLVEFYGTFLGIGMGISNPDYKFDIILPNTLTKIGSYAFYVSSLSSINIPSNVEIIGYYGFTANQNLTTLTFEGALEGKSKLQTLGINAFMACNLKYEEDTNPLILPSSITTMGDYVFSENSNLNNITLLEIQQNLEIVGMVMLL